MSRLLFPRNLKLCGGAKNPKRGKEKWCRGVQKR